MRHCRDRASRSAACLSFKFKALGYPLEWRGKSRRDTMVQRSTMMAQGGLIPSSGWRPGTAAKSASMRTRSASMSSPTSSTGPMRIVRVA